MRLLIYGGTFNPPHLGHIDALSCAAASLSADRCIVVPAGIPPHKALAEGSPTAEERLRLCELAFPATRGRSYIFSSERTCFSIWSSGMSFALSFRSARSRRFLVPTVIWRRSNGMRRICAKRTARGSRS